MASSKRYKYAELYDILAEKITAGEWKPNERMPSEAELCRRYNLSRVTVRDTLGALEREGYIYKQQGKGTFVALRPIEQKLTKLYTLREGIAAKGMIPVNKILSFKSIIPNEKVRKSLNITEDEKVYELIRCCLASDIPYAVETSYMPTSLYPDMTEEMIADVGLYKTMQSFSIIPERATEKLTATRMTAEEALLLDSADGDFAICDERITYSGANIIEYTVDIIRSDFFSYTIEL